MLSCFCGKKKSSSTSNSINKSEITVSTPDPKIDNTPKLADESTTLNLSKKDSKENQKTQKMQLVEEPTRKEQLKKISSVRQVSNESASVLNASFSSDSDTVPYQSNLEMSNSSTARMKKISSKISKQSNLYKVKHCNTVGENPINRLSQFENDPKIFHSRSKFKASKSPSSNKCSASIDYSKFSEIDMQVGSSEILDLDEEMESKLQELEYSIKVQEKSKLTVSLNRQNASEKKTRFIVEAQNIKRQKQQSKFNHIGIDFDQMGREQGEAQHNFIKNSKGLSGSKCKANFHTVRFTVPNVQDQEENKKLKANNDLVQKTVKSQLDLISDSPNQFFCATESVKSPQSLDCFRKFITTSQIPDLDQTLEQAENSFHCNSVNEQFSRALLTKQFDLALSIFEKMAFEDKNGHDLKGYTPVHLAVLSAITDDRAFDLAKKLMYHPEVILNVKGPTGWSPLQETVSYKHIRLTPNVFVSSHRKKLNIIRESLVESSQILQGMKDFELCLDVKVDSFIPLVGSLAPSDTITITKIGKQLLIDYTLVGYEFLSCKRRDMGFLINDQTILAINRSKGQYCDILEQLDKQQIQMLVVESLQSETKKIDPIIKSFDLQEARTIFDNEVTGKVNNYNAQKYIFSINYTSMTEKRMPQKPQDNKQNIHQTNWPLIFLSSWQSYKTHQHKVNVKPKNKNKKIELQMWLSSEFSFQVQNLVKIFQLFALSNPLAKTISEFLTLHLKKMQMKGKFPVKIDIPINFSLYFNLEFRALKFEGLRAEKLEVEKCKKISRKQFQKISESKEKRAFAISALT